MHFGEIRCAYRQSSRFRTLNIHASGNATAAASAERMNAFRYPPIAAWR
jgi:hypothetical protein